MNSLDRFIARSMPEPNSGCWLWMGALTSDGYGRVLVGTRKIAAHRVAYEALVGPIPFGMTLDHRCRVRCCINPAHLEPVTNKINVLRGTGPTAKHARATHCAKGHPFEGDNLFISQNARRCRTCRRAMNKRWLMRQSLAESDAPKESSP